jgi:hypothetical protein
MMFRILALNRIKNSYKAQLEVRIFSNIDQNEIILSNFKEDTFLRF